MEKLTALFKNHGLKKHSSATEVDGECGNEYTVYGDISNIQRELEEAEKIVEDLRLEKERLEKGLESATEKRFVRIKFYGSSRNCYRFDLEIDTRLNVKQLILIVNTVHMATGGSRTVHKLKYKDREMKSDLSKYGLKDGDRIDYQTTDETSLPCIVCSRKNEKKPNRSNAIVEPNPVQLEKEHEKTDDNGNYVTLYPDRLT